MSEAASRLGSRAVRGGPAVPLRVDTWPGRRGRPVRRGGRAAWVARAAWGACGVGGACDVGGGAIIDLRAHFKVFFCRRWFLIFLPYV